jgi:hypothetical protein
MLTLIYDKGRYVGPVHAFEVPRKTALNAISDEVLRNLYDKYECVKHAVEVLEGPQNLIQPDQAMLKAAASLRSRMRNFGFRLAEGYVEEQEASIDQAWTIIKPHIDTFNYRQSRLEATLLAVDGD